MKRRCFECGRSSSSFGIRGADGKVEKAACRPHKTEGMYDLKSRLCEKSGCVKRPSFGYEGEKWRFCQRHSEPGMINLQLRKCLVKGCNVSANYGYEGAHTHCNQHKEDGMRASRSRAKVASSSAPAVSPSGIVETMPPPQPVIRPAPVFEISPTKVVAVSLAQLSISTSSNPVPMKHAAVVRSAAAAYVNAAVVESANGLARPPEVAEREGQVTAAAASASVFSFVQPAAAMEDDGRKDLATAVGGVGPKPLGTEGGVKASAPEESVPATYTAMEGVCGQAGRVAIDTDISVEEKRAEARTAAVDILAQPLGMEGGVDAAAAAVEGVGPKPLGTEGGVKQTADKVQSSTAEETLEEGEEEEEEDEGWEEGEEGKEKQGSVEEAAASAEAESSVQSMQSEESKSGSRESGGCEREREHEELDVDAPVNRPAATKKRSRPAAAATPVAIAVKAEEAGGEVAGSSSSSGSTTGTTKRARPVGFTLSVPTAVKAEAMRRRATTTPVETSPLESDAGAEATAETGVAVST